MGDITAFPTLTQVVINGENVFSFVAAEAVKAGMIVGAAATGVSGEVVPMDATSGEVAIGVAINAAAIGETVGVASLGSIVNMVNADDTTAIDAGSAVGQNDNTVKGTVSAVGAAAMAVGIALDDIAGGSYGRVLVVIFSAAA